MHRVNSTTVQTNPDSNVKGFIFQEQLLYFVTRISKIKHQIKSKENELERHNYLQNI